MSKHTGPGVHDERRPQFCYQEHGAIETILQTFDGRERQATLAVYQVLTYAASCQYRNGGRDGFAKSATELAAMAGMKAPKFREHARELQKLGLVTATRRTSEAGHDLTTEWALRSTVGDPGGDPRWSPNESNGDHPTRARENRSREVETSFANAQEASTATAVDDPQATWLEVCDDALRLCQLHARLCNERTESQKYAPTAEWRRQMRLLIEADGRHPMEIEAAIQWVHRDPFWGSNILSVSTLRRQYDKIRLQARGARNGAGAKLAAGEPTAGRKDELVRAWRASVEPGAAEGGRG